MKGNDINLRREVYKSDSFKIIEWLNDDKVTRYLNEKQNIDKSIEQVMKRVNMPILTHLYNRNGTFFMVTKEEKNSIGFLKLIPKKRGAEIVVVIGDREEWGKGLGPSAIYEGLKHAFFNLRLEEVIAKIHFENERSKKAFKKVGFEKEKELAKEIQYSISIEDFLKLAS